MALVDSVITCAASGRTRESVDVGHQTSRTPRIPSSSRRVVVSTRWMLGKTSWFPSSSPPTTSAARRRTNRVKLELNPRPPVSSIETGVIIDVNERKQEASGSDWRTERRVVSFGARTLLIEARLGLSRRRIHSQLPGSDETLAGAWLTEIARRTRGRKEGRKEGRIGERNADGRMNRPMCARERLMEEQGGGK